MRNEEWGMGDEEWGMGNGEWGGGERPCGPAAKRWEADRNVCPPW